MAYRILSELTNPIYWQNPNDLRLMVRETTSTRRQPGAGGGGAGGASKAPRPSENAVEEQYYDSEIPGVIVNLVKLKT